MNAPQTEDTRTRSRPLWLYAVVGAFLLVALAVGVPAWASSTPQEFQQGTVPPPPIDPGDDDDNEDEQEEEQPVATPTPGGVAPGLALPAPTPSGVASTYTGVVNVPRLNVRSGPGVSFPPIDQLSEGQTVVIQFRDATGDWWYTCCISGTTTSGWSSSLLITPNFDRAQAMTLIPVAGTAPTAIATPSTAAGSEATVSTFRLNMRSGPSTSSAIIGKLEVDSVVTVLARSPSGEWWYVCCAPDSETEGWVASRFLAPAFPRSSANNLIPLFGQQSAGTGGSAAATASELAASTSLLASETAPLTTTIGVTVSQAPTLALQGELLELRYVITNTGDVTATAIELRNELPEELVVDRGLASGGARFTMARTTEGAEVISFLWPEIAPSDAITASLVVTVSPTLTDGVVIENLAAVSAANASAQTAAISIGLPPALIPDFR